MYYLIILVLMTSSLMAARFSASPDARSYDAAQVNKQRVDTFDFAGEYPELEHINIDAKRKKNVEILLTGHYPVLEMLNYEGSFGVLSGELTGHFPQLAVVNFLCTSCAMNLDLGAAWSRSCEINIRGADENITLNLPKDVGLVIHTKVAMKGKVIPCADLKKKGRLGVLNKTYVNDLAETAPVVLTIYIELSDGHIVLNSGP